MVLLVRHGRTPTTGRVLPGRRGGLHLSEEGQRQAEGAARRLAELIPPPAAVYASPLERTRETAAPIARALGLRVRNAPGLLECDIGEWTGERLDRMARRAEWQRVQRWPSAFRFPGGESFNEMADRTFQTVLDLVEAHRGESVVAVSHADPIRAVVAMASGTPLDLFQRVAISPCSITALAFSELGPTLLCSNSTASLAELVPS